jgi:lipoprotein-anchoring transpeptidase ErfK/SrfK
MMKNDWSHRKWRRALGTISALILMFGLIGSPLVAMNASAAPAPVSPDLASSEQSWSAPRTVFIPESGQTIDGVFLDFWRAAGGEAAYGNPISREFDRNGRIVQYYEYARFEYIPESAEGSVVQLGNIGFELRPSNVMRITSGGESKEIEQFALISRAWLPVPSDVATQPTTADFIYVPETGHTVMFGLKALWEYIGEGYLGNPISEEYIIGGTTYQVFERGQLAWTKEKGAWLVPLGSALANRQAAPMAPVTQGDVPVYDEALFIPPPPPGPYVDPNGPATWFDINLSTQYMTFYQGDREVISSYVSTGRDEFATPPGTFYINSKLPSQTMEGVLGGEYYNVPDVPWVMYFTNVGHAIHGAYWHNNFGTQMSHGCINLPLDVAELVYQYSPIGTRVEIHW